MRKLKAWLFVTLDGVMETPEKWVMFNDEMGAVTEADYAAADLLLLGRRTYEIFASSWPERSNDVPNADWMNNTAKVVVSTTLRSPEWNNSTVIDGDFNEAIAGFKEQDGKDMLINGSATLVRSLLPNGLLDELQLFVHPLVLGSGERLFATGESEVSLSLTESQAFSNGVMSLTYKPSDGAREGTHSST